MKQKIPEEIEEKMYEAHKRIWVGGMLVNKRFQDYQELVRDLDKLDYDTTEYHRLIRTINVGLVSKL